MNENINMEIDDDMMAVAQGGIETRDNEAPKFSVGDMVRYRDSDESGKQVYRMGHVVDVALDNDGWGYKYKTDSSEKTISEINLHMV